MPAALLAALIASGTASLSAPDVARAQVQPLEPATQPLIPLLWLQAEAGCTAAGLCAWHLIAASSGFVCHIMAAFRRHSKDRALMPVADGNQTAHCIPSDLDKRQAAVLVRSSTL